MNFQKIFLTLFGSGLSSIAPGTVGTLVAMPIGFLIMYYFGINSLISFTFIISIIAIFEINSYEKRGGVHDNKSIVIDEAVGVWLSMSITFGGIYLWQNSYNIYLALILSFLSFRLFDIWKPSTIGYIDRKVKGGLGVVGDDLLAGFAAGILNLLIFKLLAFLQLKGFL